jgi:hypothetical protein
MMSEDAEQGQRVPAPMRPVEWPLYELIAAEINPTFTDQRGGVDLEYHTGEQIATRLNETIGFLSWSFRVIEHGIHAEADECWVLGEMTVTIEGRTVVRQQFGSQKIKRSRSSGTPLDIGFDLKGASTDSMKKCASLIGAGLYLWKKDAPITQGAAPRGNRGNGSGPKLMPNSDGGGSSTGGDSNDFECEECGEALTETRFKDGTNWAPAQLAVFGRRKHSRILCMTHYRDANAAKRQAEEALQQVPF